MILSTLFVRFYKSFNFDYLRQSDRRVENKPRWEFLEDDQWYPFVSVPLDPQITTVVGENESGKSCLLKAIEHGVSGKAIQQRDFCRHSKFFTVEEGKERRPEFGCRWRFSSDQERETVLTTCGLPENTESLLVFHTSQAGTAIYVQVGAEIQPVDEPKLDAINASLPLVFRIDSAVGLPETVPIGYLTGDRDQAENYARWTKRATSLDSRWIESEDAVRENANQIFRLFTGPEPSSLDAQRDAKELKLAHDLLRKVARVDVKSLGELQNAIRDNRDAYAESLADKINERMELVLNFSSVWAQDRDFRLCVSPRDTELVFTIRDRTGTQYAFDERSDGLRYFLSYYIQHLAHEPNPEGRSEILVMDEPDAYLSSQGQQDLLGVFDLFANPRKAGQSPVQVVYVTHSPFLIDKNHPKRLRVLQKGARHEGTRVVRNASRNHYEPLRSALGAFVSETAFIGNCNIIVEGPSDQILIAGATRHLRMRSKVPKSETIDLNEVTVVNAGGAREVPYMVYLATGRDVERPTVIVLLDSDEEGNGAREILERGVKVTTDKKMRQLLPKDRILQLGEVRDKFGAIEDLVPLELAVAAARRYVETHSSWDQDAIEKIDIKSVTADDDGRSGYMVTRELLESVDEDFKMAKVGFASEVVGILEQRAMNDGRTSEPPGVDEFLDNMRALLARLNSMQSQARREHEKEQVIGVVQRAKERFLRDFTGSFTKDEALQLVGALSAGLDDSLEGDEMRKELNEIVRSFDLENDRNEDVEDCDEFRRALETLQYEPQRAVQTQS